MHNIHTYIHTYITLHYITYIHYIHTLHTYIHYIHYLHYLHYIHYIHTYIHTVGTYIHTYMHTYIISFSFIFLFPKSQISWVVSCQTPGSPISSQAKSLHPGWHRFLEYWVCRPCQGWGEAEKRCGPPNWVEKHWRIEDERVNFEPFLIDSWIYQS